MISEQTLAMLNDENYNSSDDSEYVSETYYTSEIISETSYIDTEIDEYELPDIIHEIQYV